jgi:hypothetical protein
MISEPMIAPTLIPLAEAKLCKDCAKLIGVRGSEDPDSIVKWKCNAKDNVASQDVIDLITGKSLKTFKYPLNILRTKYEVEGEELCGPSGKWFELYVKPSYVDPASKPTSKSLRNVSADDL